MRWFVRSKRKESIQEEIRKNENRIQNLQDILADGDLISGDFSAMKGMFEIQIQNLKNEYGTINSVKDNWEKYLDGEINIISNSKRYWKLADSVVKLL